LGRVGAPEDLVALAVLLASDAASYITGQTFCADGGLLLSGSPDWPAIARRNRAP
jgi:NAD(P)-dependent dehydrogenase (short-subunit alcohol dehydrogenase family)